MKLAEVQNHLSFTKTHKAERCGGCRPRPKCTVDSSSYGQLVKENVILRQALKNASRIIAEDIYAKSAN